MERAFVRDILRKFLAHDAEVDWSTQAGATGQNMEFSKISTLGSIFSWLLRAQLKSSVFPVEERFSFPSRKLRIRNFCDFSPLVRLWQTWFRAGASEQSCHIGDFIAKFEQSWRNGDPVGEIDLFLAIFQIWRYSGDFVSACVLHSFAPYYTQ